MRKTGSSKTVASKRWRAVVVAVLVVERNSVRQLLAGNALQLHAVPVVWGARLASACGCGHVSLGRQRSQQPLAIPHGPKKREPTWVS
jgi:hypothetical protein